MLYCIETCVFSKGINADPALQMELIGITSRPKIKNQNYWFLTTADLTDANVVRKLSLGMCARYISTTLNFDYSNVEGFDILMGKDELGMNYPVCSTSWDVSLNDAVCRQLGYGSSRRYDTVPAEDVMQTFNGYFITNGSTVSYRIEEILERSASCASSHVVSIKCTYDVCGQRPGFSSNGRKEVSNARDDHWPWQVAIYSYGGFRCGGVLLTNEWVLTSALCISPLIPFFPVYSYELKFGITDLEDHSYRKQESIASEIIRHAKYNASSRHNDIALIRLRTPVYFTDYVRPICLPAAGLEFTSDAVCYISGWGRIRPDPGSVHYFQEAAVKVVDDDTCAKVYSYFKTDEHTCAASRNGNIGKCDENQGNILQCMNLDNRWVITGFSSGSIATASDDCASYGVYSKITNYVDWIASVIPDISFSKVHQFNTGSENECK